MKTTTHILTRSNERGHTQIDWLNSRHSFSFGNFYDPDRMGFGPLRVLNDDWIEPGNGFPPHPHRDMEIVSVAIEGQLQHKDSLGNGRIIEPGEIQYMSAGSGVVHSEFNPSESKAAHFLQIWIEPTEKGLSPRYEDRKLLASQPNEWRLVLSEDGRNHSMAIRNPSELRSVVLEPGASIELETEEPLNGQWIFILSGSIETAGETLQPGDSLGIESTSLTISNPSEDPAEVLVFSVPLS